MVQKAKEWNSYYTDLLVERFPSLEKVFSNPFKIVYGVIQVSACDKTGDETYHFSPIVFALTNIFDIDTFHLYL